MERKKLVQLLSSVFIALIFLSSYVAFGDKGIPSQNPTTTVRAPQTAFSTARGNATIASFGSTLEVSVNCANATDVSSKLDSILADMEKNGTVNNFYSQQSSQILVRVGNSSGYKVYQSLYDSIGSASGCTNFVSPEAAIQLPQKMNFYLPSQPAGIIILIPSSLQSYSLPLKLKPDMGSGVNVAVSALLELNGTIYGSLSVQQV